MSRTSRVAIQLLGLLALLPPALAADTAPATVTADEWDRLEAGDVVLLEAEEEVGATVSAAVLVRAPADLVWRVMTDCPDTPEFVPNLRSCRVLEQEGDRRVVEHRVKAHALLPEMTYRIEEHWQPGRRIDFQRVGGALSEMDGTWRLVPEGASTLVRYRLTLDPGFPVPRWAIRRGLRHDLPLLLDALRDRVEAEP